ERLRGRYRPKRRVAAACRDGAGCRVVVPIVSFSPVYLRLSRERWRYLIVGARYIVPLGVDKAPPYRRLGVSRITSRYHPRCPTDKEPRVRLWPARHNCAIIAWWKRTAQSAARR